MKKLLKEITLTAALVVMSFIVASAQTKQVVHKKVVKKERKYVKKPVKAPAHVVRFRPPTTKPVVSAKARPVRKATMKPVKKGREKKVMLPKK